VWSSPSPRRRGDDWSGWAHYWLDEPADVLRLIERCPYRYGPHGSCEFGHHAWHTSPRRFADQRLRGIPVDKADTDE